MNYRNYVTLLFLLRYTYLENSFEKQDIEIERIFQRSFYICSYILIPRSRVVSGRCSKAENMLFS